MTHRHIKPIHLVIGLVVAAFNALQSRVNGALGQETGHATVTALVSFSGGILVIALMVLSHPKARRAFVGIPQLIRSGHLRWWECIGGISGAFYVIGQGFIVPIVGVAIFTIAVVAGQTVSSLFVDKVGLGPAGPKALTGLRIFSAMLAIVGVIISVLGRDHSGAFSLPAVMYAFAAGSFQSAQYAINGKVARATNQALTTTLLNFVMGTTTLWIVLFVQTFLMGKPLQSPPSLFEMPWLWTGGPIGVVFIISASVLVHHLGVLVFALVTVVGQLVGALILDIVLPTPGSHISGQLVIGVVVTGLAVTLASRRPRSAASTNVAG